MFKTLSDHDESGALAGASTYRCGGSAGWVGCYQPGPSCFPLNCGVRTTLRAPTRQILPHTLPAQAIAKPYNVMPMLSKSDFDQIAERVERLLVRHEELQRTNALLSAQVDAVTKERDSLKSRLSAARSRVDALLDRLPEAGAGTAVKDTP